MNTIAKSITTALFTAGLVVGCASTGGGKMAGHDGHAKAEEKDAGHGHDYRTFHTDGKIDYGKIGDSYTADLVMYLAGNQFMVMEELIKDFQSKNPDIKTVYVETIPPGQILKKQILAQGQIDGQDTNQNPDLFASVNINHLKKLKKKGRMSQHIVYTHNKLELMVAEGNPKGIKGPEDLGRDDLVQSHPNPLTEGIFKFYGSAMLKDLNLYDKVTAGAKCKSCWAVAGKTWFTSRHHRETPHRIENGEADVGIVWTTEVVHAKAEGRKIDGVSIPAPYNKQEEVAYAIGALNEARNAENANRYLQYLATEAAQGIYAKYGFLNATAEELTVKDL
ncbi:MAG: substrate-binding domain-containing protein [Gammaproteobacteria bacterium]|nr:substrate-binding domain-containing protein [Gammaproteobacteria bacterium]MDH5801169.1 substrate-binding domain-containing protein [Gammaproteobacteria bacterium]